MACVVSVLVSVAVLSADSDALVRGLLSDALAAASLSAIWRAKLKVCVTSLVNSAALRDGPAAPSGGFGVVTSEPFTNVSVASTCVRSSTPWEQASSAQLVASARVFLKKRIQTTSFFDVLFFDVLVIIGLFRALNFNLVDTHLIFERRSLIRLEKAHESCVLKLSYRNVGSGLEGLVTEIVIIFW